MAAVDEHVIDELVTGENYDEVARNVVDSLVRDSAPKSSYIQLMARLRERGDDISRKACMAFMNHAIDGAVSSRNPNLQLVLHCYEVSRNIELARKAPKSDSLSQSKASLQEVSLKESFYAEAKTHLSYAEPISSSGAHITAQEKELVLDAKASLHLAIGNADVASNIFNNILQTKPNHLPALFGKARLLFARKQYRPALKAYQSILTAYPNSSPDPRIGIGLCFWNLGDREMAKKSWLRSVDVNGQAKSQAALIFLGLLNVNLSKDMSNTDQERAQHFSTGINYLQSAYKIHFNASAALGIAQYLEHTQDWEKCYKLSEKAVRFADSRPVLAEAWYSLAKAAHAQNKFSEARRFYTQSSNVNADQLPVQLALAQAFVQHGEWHSAATAFETIISKHSKCVEALAGLATVRAHQSFASRQPNTAIEERRNAVKAYQDLLYELESQPQTHRKTTISSRPEIYLDIGRLWADVDINRAFTALVEAQKLIEEKQGEVSSQLLNNLGCMEHHRGNFDEAENFLGAALMAARDAEVKGGKSTSADSEGATTIAYNLGTVYESKGDGAQATRAYESMVLARHPEWVEAKARFAALLALNREHERAHTLLKEALTSQPNNLELRAMYSYYLYKSNPIKITRDFTLATLREHDRHDLYALCAAGTLYYTQARENKEKGTEAAKDRANRFVRSAEFFEKALQLDSQCAYAAQGFAITIAEGNLTGKAIGDSAHPSRNPTKNARDALPIFAKVREAINNASVYICIGHCHFVREEYERAIEAYETAFRRFYEGKNQQCQLYLARAWYHKGLNDKSNHALRTASQLIRQTVENSPEDVMLQFNLALIQQSSLDVQFDLEPSQRSLVDLQTAKEEATEALQTFENLSKMDQSKSLPFSVDVASQRSSFGRTRLKRAEEQLSIQKEYEETQEAKIEQARKEREDAEQEKAAVEAARLEEYRVKSAQLAEQRRKMKEDVSTWYVQRESDHESLDEDGKPKKSGGKRKKGAGGGRKSTAGGTSTNVTSAATSGDEDMRNGKDLTGFVVGDEDEMVVDDEQKKRKPKGRRQRNLARRNTAEDETDGGGSKGQTTDAQEISEVDGSDSQDENENERGDSSTRPSKRSRKAFKSAEIIEDSDEDL